MHIYCLCFAVLLAMNLISLGKSLQSARFFSSRAAVRRARAPVVMVSTEPAPVKKDPTVIDQMGQAGIAGAAVVAASAINQAVGMRTISGKSTSNTKGYISHTGLVVSCLIWSGALDSSVLPSYSISSVALQRPHPLPSYALKSLGLHITIILIIILLLTPKSTAPTVSEKSFTVLDGAANERVGKVDEVGLPLVYDKDLIQAYWSSQSGALRYVSHFQLSVFNM